MKLGGIGSSRNCFTSTTSLDSKKHYFKDIYMVAMKKIILLKDTQAVCSLLTQTPSLQMDVGLPISLNPFMHVNVTLSFGMNPTLRPFGL